MPREPNPYNAQIIEMYLGGMQKQQIATALAMSLNRVCYALQGQHCNKPITVKRALASRKWRIGTSDDVSDAAMAIVVKKLRGNETIISCLARLVVQMSDQIETLEGKR